MNWLDFLLIAVLAWFTLTSLTTGIIREILNLVGIVLGAVLAGRFYAPLAEVLPFVPQGDAAKISALLLIFLGTTLAAHLLAFLLHQVVSLLLLGWADHLGGALFGLVKGGLLCQLFLIVLARFPFAGLDHAISESRLASVLLGAFPILLAFLPKEFDTVRSFFSG